MISFRDVSILTALVGLVGRIFNPKILVFRCGKVKLDTDLFDHRTVNESNINCSKANKL